MKRLISILLAATLVFPAAAAFADGEDVKIYIDGVLLEPKDANGNPVSPLIIDGTTYLPVRAVAGAIGYDVEWDGDSRSVYLSSDREVIAEENIFSSLEYYSHNPYEILGRSAFLNQLKQLMGGDYDKLLFPAVESWYGEGNADLLTLHGYTVGREFVNEAVIDVHRSGRIDIAVLDPQSQDYGGKNAVKYYSNQAPDYIDSSTVLSFISTHITGNDLGYSIIDFCCTAGTAVSPQAVYNGVNSSGSLSFKPEGKAYKFSGKITQPNGAWCSTGGTLVLENNCALCTEDGKPSILFAFSGKYLTVIGLNSTTKALTSVCTY